MMHEQVEVERIYAAAESVTGVPVTAIKSVHRGNRAVSMARRCVAVVLRNDMSWPIKKIAGELRRSDEHIKTILYEKNVSTELIERQKQIENRIRAALRS